MADLRVFERLNIEFPGKEIFLRLGGNCFKTTLGESARLQLMQSSRHAFSLCQAQGRFAVLPITAVHRNGVDTPEGFLALGEDFCTQYRNAGFLWCGAVTIGDRLTGWRDETDSIAASAIADAVGSECADAAMDALTRLARNELCRWGLWLSERRFSPGYGDMPLELQKFFYDKLNMVQMGIRLTENCFLFPEKSVTAFAFIYNLQENQL